MEGEPPDLNPRDGPALNATNSHPTTPPPPSCDHSPAPSGSTLACSGPAATPALGNSSPPPSPEAGPCLHPSGQTAVGMKQLRWDLSNILVLLISEKLARLVISRAIYLNAGLFYTLE